MNKELADTLLDFYRTVLQPDLQRIHNKLSEHDSRYSQMLGHFDKTFQQLSRLEDEHHAIVHGLDRADDRGRAAAETTETHGHRLHRLEERTSRLEARSAP